MKLKTIIASLTIMATSICGYAQEVSDYTKNPFGRVYRSAIN